MRSISLFQVSDDPMTPVTTLPFPVLGPDALGGGKQFSVRLKSPHGSGGGVQGGAALGRQQVHWRPVNWITTLPARAIGGLEPAQRHGVGAEDDVADVQLRVVTAGSALVDDGRRVVSLDRDRGRRRRVGDALHGLRHDHRIPVDGAAPEGPAADGVGGDALQPLHQLSGLDRHGALHQNREPLLSRTQLRVRRLNRAAAEWQENHERAEN